MRRTLVLVLSALRSPWNTHMECSRSTWDAEFYPRVDTLYYVGRNNPHFQSRTFYSKFDEELHNVGHRTLEAYQHALTLSWTHLARPHSSTYVHKPTLAEYVDTLPEQDWFGGLATGGPYSFMWGGGHYVFSRDVIERIVKHKEEWNHNVMEDVAVSELTKALGIPWSSGRSATIGLRGDGYSCLLYNHGDSFNFTDFADVPQKAKGHFMFRVKQDMQREKDLQIMRQLHKHLS